MTQEEKQLLLKDLCSRLPYGVKCYAYQYKIDGNDCECAGTLTGINGEYFYLSDRVSVNGGKTYDERYREVKPYLCPMSSMTEEEKEEFRTLISPEASCAYEDCLEWDAQIIGSGYLQISVEDFSKVVDWLNEHHFDFRGLIPMGLALEAPEDMYII